MVDQASTNPPRYMTGLQSMQSLGWGAVAMHQLAQLINWSGSDKFQPISVDPWTALIATSNLPPATSAVTTSNAETPVAVKNDAETANVVAPADTTQADDTARVLVEQAAAEQLSAEKIAAEKAAEEKAEIERATADKVAAERVAVELQAKAEAERAAQAVAAKQAADERASLEKAEADKRAAEQLESQLAAQERLKAQQAADEKASSEKAAAEKVAAEKVAAEKAASEKAAAEKRAAENLAAMNAAEAERVAAQKTAQEKASAERLAAAKTNVMKADEDHALAPAPVLNRETVPFNRAFQPIERPSALRQSDTPVALPATVQLPVAADSSVEAYLTRLEQLVLQLNMELGRRDQATSDPIQDLSQRVIDLNLENLALKEQLRKSTGNRHE